ncbi:SDR family oxidoreductase, partial [Exiguobacterium sp. s150]|uniref:SDR family NAD(P)-dependent oxidoreductase n=1 Tax=Exiguobacterium sp. s150 TaxID=2751221 RepID=UPI001BE869AE
YSVRTEWLSCPHSVAQKNAQVAHFKCNNHTLTALTRLYTPAMLERRHGGVINLASIVAFQPGPLMAVYYASKAHVLSFTEALASELAVTALCPGPTETGFADVTGLEKSVLFQRFRPVPAKDVAEFGYRAWEKGKVVAIYGLPNKSLVFGERFLPRGVTSNLMKWMQKKAV